MIKVSGCIFCSVAESRRQGVDAILCVGIGNESADDPESVCVRMDNKKKRKDIIDRCRRAMSTCSHTQQQQQLTQREEARNQGKDPE